MDKKIYLLASQASQAMEVVMNPSSVEPGAAWNQMGNDKLSIIKCSKCFK